MHIDIPGEGGQGKGDKSQSGGTWSRHHRPPNPTSDSYFPSSASGHPSKTPKASSVYGHSRGTSASGNASHATAPPATTPSKGVGHSMSLSLSSVKGGQDPQPSSAHPQHGMPHDFAPYEGHFSHGPPSPSTLTDIILGLHSTLYGGKRSADEVRQMVQHYYEYDALFESPLLAAVGREQIANQFIMAFALPGMDVTSELRDVICSDFEFDGTRAGIIDQTISVTFLPSLFGSAPPKSTARTPAPGATSHAAHSSLTPHPFLNYASGSSAYPAPNNDGSSSVFSRFGFGGGGAAKSGPHSPVTPYSLWGSSRPHTPGPGHSIRPMSSGPGSSAPHSAHPWHARASTPPSVNGDYDEDEQYSYGDAEGDGVTTVMHRPTQPAVVPHWSHEGLGRSTVSSFVWGLFHPRQVLRHLCTIQLRLMSRLEFNDAGRIVRHEDTWGLREAIEGTIPFVGLFYAIERRVVGYLCSWAIGKGVRLSDSITKALLLGGHHERKPSSASHHYLLPSAGHTFTGHPHYHTISRSRATSPTRYRFMSSGSTPGSHTVTGTRSRARSLVGSHGSAYPSRAPSHDNLAAWGQMHGVPGVSSATGEYPPDSGARYRDRAARRLEGGRASSTTSAPAGDLPNSHSLAAGTTTDSSGAFLTDKHGSVSGAHTLDSIFQPPPAPDRDEH
ncbi:hypothetical protein IE81DRAFT_288630 [Ceraceosorus guamensis]|uniref:Uncharacterized protein n=1 Tax=Ceraceosorus guamensis TaxID=1522189 RepID=A0A316W325_9BASI|nr:hypothetical protein IE81DRAFT_288630 [Ceraceosorus guamensis]PWN43498.1 hypothetical protein IE81DRAFT_288630 [Ceraceosorus guamensis]